MENHCRLLRHSEAGKDLASAKTRRFHHFPQSQTRVLLATDRHCQSCGIAHRALFRLMEIFVRILLAIYLAHLLADFIFQSSRLVEQKLRGKFSGYLLHGLIHYVTSILLVGFFVRASAASFRTYLVLLALSAIHLLLDPAQIRLTARGLLRNDALAYRTDQLIHFLTIVLAPSLPVPCPPLTPLFTFS